MSNHLQEILAKAGIVGPEAKTGPLSIAEEMNKAGLTNNKLFNSLNELIDNPESGNLQLKAIETALKTKGVMKDSGSNMVPVQIVINDPGTKMSINPILVPREMQKDIEILEYESN